MMALRLSALHQMLPTSIQFIGPTPNASSKYPNYRRVDKQSAIDHELSKALLIQKYLSRFWLLGYRLQAKAGNLRRLFGPLIKR